MLVSSSGLSIMMSCPQSTTHQFHMLAFIRSIDVAPKDEEHSHGVPGGGVGGMGGMDM